MRRRVSLINSKVVECAVCALSCCVAIVTSGCSASFLLSSAASAAHNSEDTPILIVSTSQTPSSYGNAIIFTARTSNGPTGIVTFYDGENAIGTGTLNGSTATLVTNTLAVGSHVITASWPGGGNYNAVTSAPITQAVNAATPTITWPAPAAITYGATLSTVQLDASSSVPGAFLYSPSLGAVLNAGTQTLSATFTPTDTADYDTVTATTTLIVNPPSIVISAPGMPILAGTTYGFTASESGSSQSVEWAVDGITGGSSEVGTITAGGVYTAPNTSNATVTVSAMLQANPAIQGSVEVQVIGPASSPGTIGFAFSLPTSAATSAGVYDLSGNLVRTLWSNKQFPAGPEAASWDGNDDFGNSLAAGSYQIRVLYNNVTYTWGVIGDTSQSWVAANSWDRQNLLPQDVAVIGSTAYVANGYEEMRNNATSFSLSDPQQATVLFGADSCSMLEFAATDGTLLYFASQGDGWGGSVPYVMAFDPTNSSYYTFPGGTPYNNPCSSGNAPTSVIDEVTTAGTGSSRTNIPTGLAVQANGNILAVSHGTVPSWVGGNSHSQDVIKLFNKTSGALVGTINISNPQRLAFAPDGDLWAISGSSVLLITSVGSANTITSQLPSLSAPLAIAVDPSTDDVLVADGGQAQQVKRYSAAGELLSTYGEAGGYTDCNPTVTKTRLFLDSTAGPGYAGGSATAFLAALPDGSFWVGDPGNARVLHISANGQYIEQIAFLRALYHIAVDHGNPTRVFADDLEFSIDHTQPLVAGDPDPVLGGDGSWSLVKNWSVCLPGNYEPQFIQVQTFGNGHTYGSVPNTNVGSILSGANLNELVELPSSGPLRFSGLILEDQNMFSKSIAHEGNLSYWEYSLCTAMNAYVQNLVGYDPNEWPMWSNPQLIASLPTNGQCNPAMETINTPLAYAGWGMGFWPESTNSGMLVTYNTSPGTPGEDHHIGGVHIGGTNWAWQASPGALITTPDDQGTFPDNQSFGGHDGIAALVEGSNVFQGYDGQYGTFSSQWMHWSQDGLLIGQFGNPATGYVPDGDPGAAGNIWTMATATDLNGIIYLYNSDESVHPGIHQWKISGLDTINEINGSTTLGGVVILQ